MGCPLSQLSRLDTNLHKKEPSPLCKSGKSTTFARMNSKLLKIDAPYNVIYAGGKVGRHIATLMVWNNDEEMGGGIMDAASYPVIDEGEEFPAGTLIDYAELHDCRVICPYSEKEGCPASNLYWVAKMIEYDFQQIEPAGAEYILERMKLLGCKIAMPTEKDKETGEEVYRIDFDVTLYVRKLSGPVANDNEGVFRVTSNHFSGFYFEAEGTPEEIQRELRYQRSVYLGAFLDEINSISFHTSDLFKDNWVEKLNQRRDII